MRFECLNRHAARPSTCSRASRRGTVCRSPRRPGPVRPQSALSRQIQTLEEQLGATLFQRQAPRTAPDRCRAESAVSAKVVLEEIAQSVARIARADRAADGDRPTSHSSLWLIPRISPFERSIPAWTSSFRPTIASSTWSARASDLAIRYCSRAMARGAPRLFGERLLPVCSPAVEGDRGNLCASRRIQHHVTAHWVDEGDAFPGSLVGLAASAGLRDLKPAGSMRFSHYDQVMQAAQERPGRGAGTHAADRSCSSGSAGWWRAAAQQARRGRTT